MENDVFERHKRLQSCPPALFVYILYRRLVEHGLKTTWLWVKDKLVRRQQGFSIPEISQIAPHLYVGGQHRRHGLAAMREQGITAVVNMREESDDVPHGLGLDRYLWLPTIDDAAPTLEDLERGAAFIHEQVSAGQGVYIHCASGVGRAATMAAAYLVSRGATPEEAWARVQQGRPFVRPTPPQVAAVRDFAERQAGQDPTRQAAEDEPASETMRVSQSAPETTDSGVDAVADAEAPTEGDQAREGAPPAFGNRGAMAQRMQEAFERISGDPNLTGSLTDKSARVLLSWAEKEVSRLTAQTAAVGEEDAWNTLNPQLRHLRRYLRDMAETAAEAPDPSQWLNDHLNSPNYPTGGS